MENQYIRFIKRQRFAVLVFTVMLVLCAVSSVARSSKKKHSIGSSFLQNNVQELMLALKPGDKMPDSFWDMPMELDDFKDKKSNFKFGDMKGRIIIFDFWSTTCKSCIENIPHMEQIQEKYPDELAIILVNSKRNRDTPGRIKATMKRYKEQYKYDIGLFTILDDTLLTTLFPHNSIPSTAWINQEGIYMGNTRSNEVNVANIASVLKTGKAPLSVSQVYRNFENRLDVPPLRDTVGAQFISEITKFNPYYLPTYPNVFYKNGQTSYQMINNTFAFMLYEAFKKELYGLSWTDYAFDHGMEDIKYKVLNSIDNGNIFSYQLYVRDSISQKEAESNFQEAFSKYFKMKVVRKNEKTPIYQVSFNANFDKIIAKEEMPIIQPYPLTDPEQYRNAPVSLFLTNLFYYLDRPLVFDQNDNRMINIILPADFASRSIAERLAFLADRGIVLNAVQMKRDYAEISRLN